MTSRPTLRGAALAGVTGAVSLATVLAPTGALAARAPVATTGPTSSVRPYVLPTADGVSITSLWSVGDKAGNDYRMVGIPDGLGLSVGADGLDLYMNHELTAGVGAVRDHGQKGAFVSHEVIDPATGAVVSGDDLIKTVSYWDYASSSYVSAAGVQAPFGAAFARFCSGALTAPGQLWDAASSTGYDGQVYFANEENGRHELLASLEGLLDGLEGLLGELHLDRLGLARLEGEGSLLALEASARDDLRLALLLLDRSCLILVARLTLQPWPVRSLSLSPFCFSSFCFLAALTTRPQADWRAPSTTWPFGSPVPVAVPVPVPLVPPEPPVPPTGLASPPPAGVSLSWIVTVAFEGVPSEGECRCRRARSSRWSVPARRSRRPRRACRRPGRSACRRRSRRS